MSDDFLNDSPLFRRGHSKKSLLDSSNSNDDLDDDDDDFDKIFGTFPRKSTRRRGAKDDPSSSFSSSSSLAENLNLDDILKDIDNEFFTDDAEKILDAERKHKEVASKLRGNTNDSDDLFADLEDLDAANDDEETYSSYALLEQLKGLTGYKGSNIGINESATTTTTRQGPSNTMNSIFWDGSQKQQQEQSLDDFARELEKTFELSDDENENDEGDFAPEIKEEGSENEEKEEEEEEEEEVNIESLESDDLSDVEVPIKTSKELNANLLELHLVSEDSDDDGDDDELFLSKRTPRNETRRLESGSDKEKEEEEIDGMTRMTVGEDPLSKPKLTAQSAMRRSVSTITSVPVSLSMTPLGMTSTPTPLVETAKPTSTSQQQEQHQQVSPPLTAQTASGQQDTDEAYSIEGVKFFRIITPLPQEWAKERKELIVHLKKYQSKLEDEGLKQQRKVDALEEERRRVQAKLTEELHKYASWHKPHLVRLFREYVQLRLALFAVQSSIAAERSMRLMKKLGDVRTLRQEADVRVVLVDPSFYADPLATPPSPRDERRLKAIGKCVRALGPKVKKLVLESSKVFSFNDRRSSLLGVLNRISDDALKGTFFAPDYEVQADFDSWLLDARTQEGQQVAHFCSTVADPTERAVTADDIVLFIDEFVGHIIATYQITSPEDGAKLALLVQRALFPLIYEDVLRMDPEQQGETLRSRDLALLERLEHLREERHPGIQIDPVFWSKRVDPLVDAEKVIAYLPFQLSPPDMIYVLQKTIAAICQVGKTFLHHNLAADEIVPLLVHTIVFAAPPGLHEALFMMEYLSQDVDRTGEAGWCIAAFETSLNHIDGLRIKTKKTTNK